VAGQGALAGVVQPSPRCPPPATCPATRAGRSGLEAGSATSPIGREESVMLLRPGETAMRLAANRVVREGAEAWP
jgi:hypothetical protein